MPAAGHAGPSAVQLTDVTATTAMGPLVGTPSMDTVAWATTPRAMTCEPNVTDEGVVVTVHAESGTVPLMTRRPTEPVS